MRGGESLERAECLGLRDTTVNWPQQGAAHHSLPQLFSIQLISLSAKTTRCRLSPKKSFVRFRHANFLIRRKMNS